MFIFFLFCLELTISQRIIKYPIFLNDDRYIGIFKIGQYKKKIYFEINVESQINWATSQQYDRIVNVKVISSGKTTVFGKAIKYFLLNEPLFTRKIEPEYKLDNFFFYYFTDEFDFNSIGLAYKPKNIKHSLIHSMADKGFIDYIKFGFTLIKGNHFIYFGGFDKEIKSENPFTLKVKVNKIYKDWGFDITCVRLGNLSYKKKHYGYFTTKKKYISVPSNFIKFLYENFLKEFIVKGKCIDPLPGKNDYPTNLDCDCDFIKPKMKYFIFELGEKSFELNIGDYFIFKIKDKCRVVLNENNNEKNEWEFGILFILQFKTEFDYTNNEIVFHSTQPFSTFNFLFHMQKIIFFICISLLLIHLLFLLIVLIKNKK